MGTGTAVIRQSDVPWSEVTQGMEITRGITQDGFTTLGGGWVRMDGSGELAGWTLKYDEVLYCVEGEIEVEEHGGQTAVAQAGEGILIGEGATVTYRARRPSLIFFVLNPRDWAERS